MPPEALTRSSDVVRWFLRMERYFRAADVPDNRRAAMLQYHMDEAMGDVLSVLEVEETDDYGKLKSTLFRVFGVNNSEERYMKEFINRHQRENESAFPQLKDQADGILLQQFQAGIRQDMIKFTILRSAPVSFEKAVEIVAREEFMINQVSATTASASVVTTAADVKKETSGYEGETGSAAAIHAEHIRDKLTMKEKVMLEGEITGTTRTKAVLQRRRPQRSDRFPCWTCGQLGHFSQDCLSHSGSQLRRDEPQSRWRFLWADVNARCWLIWGGRDPCSRGGYEGIEGFKASNGDSSWRHGESSAHGPMGQGRFPSVPAKVGFYALAPLQPVPGCKLFGNTTVQHPVQQSHCRAPLRMKNANSRSQILVAMEQILPKEQETGRKYQPTLTAILEQFSDVLGTRIAYHQRAQVETLLNGMMPRDVIEPSCSPWASPIVLVNKKHGSSRFCDDYRQLKNVTQKDAHPLPRIDDTLDDLDFECLVYLDDVTESFSRTAEEHTARLQEVLDRLRKAGMKVKPEKCQLMKRKVAYSGHIISEKGIATVPSKTRAVKEWQAPFLTTCHMATTAAKELIYTTTRNRNLTNRMHENDNHVKRDLYDVYTRSTPRLCNIRPLLEMFEKCCVVSKDEEIQCVDERIIPYKGKHKLKQYLPCKPHK
ncbi:Retrovirus-related Pol polyprotein from transposon [Trichinella murrelli]|uniref:Retrovirus-related Pol polyprotein from transposon n=1 Tax=Trichinella murrelli TaxID=144512 RepID=A0A0V0T568_9BILA|nr:Retrovirus-related Pol polyprotein from transposon [Trichinella murrelli]